MRGVLFIQIQTLRTFNDPFTEFTVKLDLAYTGLHSSERHSIQQQCIRNITANLFCFFKEKLTSVCVTSKPQLLL